MSIGAPVGSASIIAALEGKWGGEIIIHQFPLYARGQRAPLSPVPTNLPPTPEKSQRD